MDTTIYQNIARWFERWLKDAYPKASVQVYDTHGRTLNQFIRIHNLQAHFQDTFWETYEIKVDITAFITIKGKGELAFVEIRKDRLRLADLFSLSLSCMVANPLIAYLLSPQSMSAPLHSLLVTKGRSDILIYYQNKRETRNIVVGQWNEQIQEVDPASKIPAGSLAMLEANL